MCQHMYPLLLWTTLTWIKFRKNSISSHNFTTQNDEKYGILYIPKQRRNNYEAE